MLTWVGERGSLLPSSDQAFDIVLLSFPSHWSWSRPAVATAQQDSRTTLYPTPSLTALHAIDAGQSRPLLSARARVHAPGSRPSAPSNRFVKVEGDLSAHKLYYEVHGDGPEHVLMVMGCVHALLLLRQGSSAH